MGTSSESSSFVEAFLENVCGSGGGWTTNGAAVGIQKSGLVDMRGGLKDSFAQSGRAA